MKKSEKSQNNKKFKVVIIYGAPAVGKFTIAKELAKLTDFKIFHNHDLKDFIWRFFERGTYSDHYIFEKTVLALLEETSKNKMNVIFTNTHSKNFVSKTGITNVGLYKKIEKVVTKNGGEVCHVQLIAEPKEILKRTSHRGRASYGKLKDPKIMEEVLKEKDWFSSSGVKNQMYIDNTKISPSKVADMVIQHFKLK